MGLKKTVEDAVVTAIEAVGDIAKWIDYNVITPNDDYDTTTGEVTTTSQTIRIKCIISTPKAERNRTGVAREDNLPEVKGATSDLQIMLAAKSLHHGGVRVVPTTVDIIRHDDCNYQIKEISTDPAGASFTLIIGKM